MTVSKLSRNRLKITISNTEVLCCFGSYERLESMTDSIRSALSALLRDIIIENRQILSQGRITAKIKLKKNCGCEIILVAIPPKRQMAIKEYIFEFSDSESLIGAVLQLYTGHSTARLESSLYKMPDSYRLMIKSRKQDLSNILREYYSRECSFVYESEYTREHGKALIVGNAVKRFGAAFFKEP